MTLDNEQLILDIALVLEEANFNPEAFFSEEYLCSTEKSVLAATGDHIDSDPCIDILIDRFLAEAGIHKSLHRLNIKEAIKQHARPRLHHSLRAPEAATEVMLCVCIALTQIMRLEMVSPYLKWASQMIAKVNTDKIDSETGNMAIKLAKYEKCITEAIETEDYDLMINEFFGEMPPSITMAMKRCLMHIIKIKASWLSGGKFFTHSYKTKTNTAVLLAEENAASA